MASKLPDHLSNHFFPDYLLLNKMVNMSPIGEYYHVSAKNGTHYMVRCGLIKDLEKEYNIPFTSHAVLTPKDRQIIDHKMAILYEYPVDGCDLKTKILKTTGKINENTILSWIFDILRCLQELHENRILHGNLCLEAAVIVNVAGEERIKLAGISQYIRLESDKSSIRTTDNQYNICTPPEHLLGSKRTKSSDIWSLGIMIYFMMTKRYPFTDELDKLKDVLDEYKSSQSKLIVPDGYSRTLVDLLKQCLIYNIDETIGEPFRPNPNKLLQDLLNLDMFSTLPRYSYTVIRSRKCHDHKLIYERGKGPSRMEGINVYQCGKVAWMEPNYIQVGWNASDRNTIFYSQAPQEEFAVCTNTNISDSMIPLFKNVKVVRGPDWDFKIHGNNDEYGVGTVLQVVPGSEAECNKVIVKWPVINRIVQYIYGNYLGTQRYEVQPAYHPILPYMKVHNLPGKDKFQGIITEVLESQDSAMVERNGVLERLKYGEDGKFDFMVDEMYNGDFYLKSVKQYLEDIPKPNYEGEINDDDIPKIKDEIIKSYITEINNEHHDRIQNGMFVVIPPHIKECIYCIIEDIRGETVKVRAVLHNKSMIGIQEYVLMNAVKQCTYGDFNHPPLCIGNEVCDVRNNVYSVLAISNSPTNHGRRLRNNWHYLICRSQFDKITAFRYDEVVKKTT